MNLWYATLIVAFLLSLLGRRAITSLLAGWIAAIGGWGLPLAWQSLHMPIGRTASLITGIMGFGNSPVLSIALTLLIAFLFGSAGAWLAIALAGLFRRAHSRPLYLR